MKVYAKRKWVLLLTLRVSPYLSGAFHTNFQQMQAVMPWSWAGDGERCFFWLASSQKFLLFFFPEFLEDVVGLKLQPEQMCTAVLGHAIGVMEHWVQCRAVSWPAVLNCDFFPWFLSPLALRSAQFWKVTSYRTFVGKAGPWLQLQQGQCLPEAQGRWR